ncbi:MAG: cytidylate kinase-like family protein [Oscillospiraceae bacterium]
MISNTIITIGREYGSGGHEVGIRLAKRLNIPFYDKALTELISENSDFAEEFLASNEEKVDLFNLPIGAVNSVSTDFQPTFSDKIFINQSNLIKSLADKGPCVIVGRCADYVLRDYNTINVFVYANIESRIERKLKLLSENQGETMEYAKMKKQINKIDKARKAYYEFYSDKKWGSISGYDLCVSTDKVGIDGVCDTISSFVASYISL